MQGDDRDENIDEDEQDDEEGNDPAWAAQPQAPPAARRPVPNRPRGGIQRRSRKPVPQAVDLSGSDSDSDRDPVSDLETPAEETDCSRPKNSKELVAVKLANYMGLELTQMFAALDTSRSESQKLPSEYRPANDRIVLGPSVS